MKKKYIEVIKDKPLTKKQVIGFVFLSLFISIVVLLIIWLSFFQNNLSIKDFNTNNQIEIGTGEMFVEEIIKNSKMGSKFGRNKTYKLTKNIVLSSKDVQNIEKTKGIAFYGKLSGCNYSLSAEKNVELHSPIFLSLGKNALIECLSIESIKVVGKVNKPIAVLVETNYGTIQNVAVEVSLYINSASEAAAISAFNYGRINHCVANVHIGIESKFLTDDANVSKDWGCKFGAITSVNGEAKEVKGEIKDVIVAVDFPADFIVLSRQLNKNTNVGYVVGAWTDATQITNASVLNGQFYLTAHDFADLFTTGRGSKTVKNIQNGEMTHGNHPGWVEWKFNESGNELPILIQNFHN